MLCEGIFGRILLGFVVNGLQINETESIPSSQNHLRKRQMQIEQHAKLFKEL